METGYLLDYFRTSPEQRAVCKRVDRKTRKKLFDPMKIRIALDRRDGEKQDKSRITFSPSWHQMRPSEDFNPQPALDSVGIGAGGPEHASQQGSSVTTIERVAACLGENVDYIHDVALEMDTEAGVIWGYVVGACVIAFTDLGIQALAELIEIHNDLRSRSVV